MSFKKLLAPTILSASLMIGIATPVLADQDDRCRRDIHRAEQNLDKAVRKHGEHSRKAEYRRRQLEETRERCHMRGEDRDHHDDRDHH